ncbi:Mor transcription activator family protein, partial [Acinetobacter baumannii]
DEELIALMPKNFAFVAKLIGIKPALSLIESYGGILVFVPHKHALGIHHELSQIIGYSKLQLLSEHLGNNSIEVPMATTITIAMRNRTIREMAAKKESRSKIARKFGVTIRTIRHIVNGEEKLKFNLDQNLDLFE